MTSKELQQYLLREFPQENARCEWKEMKNLKNSFAGDAKNDVISYVSAIANMEGGHLVIGVQDKTLEIVGTNLSKFNLNAQSAVWKLLEHCTNLSSEGLNIDEYTTRDTHKTVWIIHIPKHLPRRPVYAHKKAWQRIEDSLVEMTQERLSFILEEPVFEAKDWSAEIVPNATVADLDELAVAKARIMFKKVHSSNIPAEEIDAWTVEDFLSNSGIIYLQNAGQAGAKRDTIFDYLKDVLPKNKTSEQQERMLGNILVEMKEAGRIILKGRIWYIK